MPRLGSTPARLALGGMAVALAASAVPALTAAEPAAAGQTHAHQHDSDAVGMSPAPGTKVDTRRAPATGAAGDPGNVVDLAFLYTPQLVTERGGQANLEADFQAAITQINTALTNSQVPVQIRMVGSGPTATNRSGNLFTDLDRLVAVKDGFFDEAHALREQTHADLVSLWLDGSVPTGEACGIGGLGGYNDNPAVDAEYNAFTILYAADCALTYNVFAHEVGHNFGGDHDVAAAAPPNSRSEPDARGYVDLAASPPFMSTMAYYEACYTVGVNCTRSLHFSNPAVSVNGRPTGSATANNARVMTSQAPIVANYRQSQIYAGAPTLAGARFRHATSATVGAWAPGNVTFSYEWLLDGQPIPGEVGSSVTPQRTWVGRLLQVRVTGSAPHYTPVSAISPGVVVGKATFTRTPRPRVAGRPRVGRVLSARVKGWKPRTKRISYTWVRNGKTIKGATKRTYRLRGKDRRKKVWVVVTARKAGFEPASRRSKKIRVR